MNTFAKVAALAMVGFALTLGTAQAGIVFHDYTPIDVPPPPLDIPDAPPLIDVPPIINDDLNDAILDDKDHPKYYAEDGTELVYMLACRIVDGDLIITNKGDKLPAGTKIVWKADGDRGTVKLANTLAYGKKVKVENAVDAEGGKCTAVVIL